MRNPSSFCFSRFVCVLCSDVKYLLFRPEKIKRIKEIFKKASYITD